MVQGACLSDKGVVPRCAGPCHSDIGTVYMLQVNNLREYDRLPELSDSSLPLVSAEFGDLTS